MTMFLLESAIQSLVFPGYSGPQNDSSWTICGRRGYSVQSSLWALSDVRETGLIKEGSRWKLGAKRARAECLRGVTRELLDQMHCERMGARRGLQRNIR